MYATTGSSHRVRHATRFGGDIDMVRYTVDLRHFLPVRDGHVLGVQAYLRATTGDVPFSTCCPGSADRTS
jgi:hypothetical protein